MHVVNQLRLLEMWYGAQLLGLRTVATVPYFSTVRGGVLYALEASSVHVSVTAQKDCMTGTYVLPPATISFVVITKQ